MLIGNHQHLGVCSEWGWHYVWNKSQSPDTTRGARLLEVAQCSREFTVWRHAISGLCQDRITVKLLCPSLSLALRSITLLSGLRNNCAPKHHDAWALGKKIVVLLVIVSKNTVFF